MCGRVLGHSHGGEPDTQSACNSQGENIFTVSETVAKTELWIEEGKLLQAQQSLVDLENSRDDLMFELHRLGHKMTPWTETC